MTFWESLLVCITAVAGAIPLFLIKPHGKWYAAGLLIVCGAGVVPFGGTTESDRPGKSRRGAPAAQQVPAATNPSDYVSSRTCQSCHPGAYHTWHQSYHRTMTQVADPESVIGNFQNVSLSSQGRTYHLSQEGDNYWVTMPDPEQESQLKNDGIDLNTLSEAEVRALTVKRQVVMTTGSHHMQTYWVRTFAGNHLRQVPWYFLQEEQRWVPREDIALMPPDIPRNFPLWNASCITCHSVAGNPGMESRQNTLFSSVAELGIACEACHGPAQEHIQHHSNPLNRYRQYASGEPDSTIINPGRCDPKLSSQICGQCHSYFQFKDFSYVLAQGPVFRPGDDMDRSRQVTRFDSTAHDDLKKTGKAVYWNDAACRTGGDEYNGLIESACHIQGGMSCLSCHSMHSSDPNDQLAKGMTGDHACLQCHDSFAQDIPAHTHHAADSSGSRCYNCHMPHTSFALLTAMRSHRIDSPSAAVSAKTGRPNACNLCHLDRTLKWTAENLNEWYEIEPPELSPEEQTVAASILWMLQGDAVQRVISAWHAGWKPAQDAAGTDWQPPYLSALLEDPYSVVRYVAHKSLRQLPGFESFEFDYVGPPPYRTRGRRDAFNQWLTAPDLLENSETLIGPGGRLNKRKFQELLQHRNDEPVWVLE